MSYANIIFSRFDFVLLQIIMQEAGIMNQGKIVFAQIVSLIPRYEFDKWFRKTHQSVGRVEIENIPDDEPTLKSSRRRGRKAEPDGSLTRMWYEKYTICHFSL